mmetsp:Transcript_15747/g.38070  ORF Transcript_15747/g.38070 Transcript_15747/m.38070 type:complete len:208 (-) Transcript_15747:19-642(-)
MSCRSGTPQWSVKRWFGPVVTLRMQSPRVSSWPSNRSQAFCSRSWEHWLRIYLPLWGSWDPSTFSLGGWPQHRPPPHLASGHEVAAIAMAGGVCRSLAENPPTYSYGGSFACSRAYPLFNPLRRVFSCAGECARLHCPSSPPRRAVQFAARFSRRVLRSLGLELFSSWSDAPVTRFVCGRSALPCVASSVCTPHLAAQESPTGHATL